MGEVLCFHGGLGCDWVFGWGRGWWSGEGRIASKVLRGNGKEAGSGIFGDWSD